MYCVIKQRSAHTNMEFIFIAIILIMSVVIHEVSHGYAALALGDQTAKYEGRLTLNPFYHLDPVGSILVPLLGYFTGGFLIGWAKPVPFNPYNLKPEKWGLPAQAGEAIVAAAGPLSNILLAVIFGIFLRYSAGFVFLNQQFLSLAAYVVVINITLAVFNLVPLPPLDGSKIFFAFLPYRWHELRDRIERFGIVFAVVFIFFFWQFLSPVIDKVFSYLVNS
jgi:Zn-dependent protease